MKSKEKRILGRILAKELSREELGLVSGGTVVVAFAATESDESGPKIPISTLVATLPDYHEDQ